jgi:hypothetical protein
MTASRTMAMGFLAVVAAAQTLLDDSAKIADARKLLDNFQGRRAGCDVLPMRPQLDFSLRLESGYYWRLNLNQSEVARQKWIVLARVTPQDGNRRPAYLSGVAQFAENGDIDWEQKVGHFWIGEGRYAVKFLMFDECGRTCRKDWEVKARLSASERTLAPRLPPNGVAGDTWSVASHPTGIERLTILMNVGDEVRTADQVMLMNALTALLGELPARSVRLVLFDLTQRKELFRRDNFTPEELPEVDKAIRAVQFEPVDVAALQNGGTDVIENLANLEIHSPEPSAAVVFLGLPSLYKSKPSASLGQPLGTGPQFFYVLCPPSGPAGTHTSGGMRDDNPYGPAGPWEPGGRVIPPPIGTAGPRTGPLPRFPSSIPQSGGGPDSILYAVQQLGGKTLTVSTPDAFVKAIAQITRAMAHNR